MESLAELRQRLATTTDPIDVVEPWSTGYTLTHCAQSIDYLIDGFPKPRSIVVRRVFGPLAARRFLREGVLTHDTSDPIPGAPEIDPDAPSDQGRDRLLEAIDRYLDHTGPIHEHFAYGKLSHEDGARLNVLHVRSHLAS